MQDKGLLPGTFEIERGSGPGRRGVAVIAVSRIAAFFAGRRAGRVRPVEALMEAARPVGGIGWLRALAGPRLRRRYGAPLLVAHVGPGLDRTGAGARDPDGRHGHRRALRSDARADRALVAGSLHRPLSAPPASWRGQRRYQVRRLASAVIPLALTIGVAGMTLFQQSTLEEEAAASGGPGDGEHVVAAGPPGSRRRCRRAGRARRPTWSGSPTRASTATSSSTPTRRRSCGASRRRPARPRRRARAPCDLAEGGRALGRRCSGLGAEVGEPVHLRLGDGTAHDLALVAVYARSLGFADVLLPWDRRAAI